MLAKTEGAIKNGQYTINFRHKKQKEAKHTHTHALPVDN